ncbi:hypothetical protein MBRA_58090 (plasmid) [Mycobacterium branderi]|uniref:AttH domain-containing protein n=1 Tax=Mycobacterium branderi TaxID=43348 RepID=A0ABN6BG98_9MYCO|nr:hypothetical protein MBRA_58090 [Mycobacterium branderi]
MLVPLDDYFIHQSTDSIAIPGGGRPEWQERNYFNVHSTNGDVLLVCGMGTTPNTDLASAYVISAVPGINGGQTDWRGVRPISGDRARMDIGEFTFEIVEPMKQWRITMMPNGSGLEMDLSWTARHRPWEFDRISAAKPDGEAIHDFAHLHQSGTYRGWMKIDGNRYEADGWYGVRDRTWGIREGLDFWIWSCVQFPDRSLSLYHFEDAAGQIQYSSGGFCYPDRVGPGVQIVDHDFELAEGERVPSRGTVQLQTVDGKNEALEFRALGPLVSYMAPEPVDLSNPYASALGRPEAGWEHWPNKEYADAARRHGTIHDSLCEFRLGNETGYGVFELVALQYQRYGWTTPFEFSASIEAGKGGKQRRG